MFVRRRRKQKQRQEQAYRERYQPQSPQLFDVAVYLLYEPTPTHLVVHYIVYRVHTIGF